ncbi:MAG TPA: asparagine synthetase B, partial [Magnetospirillum sp.]|nr:asparagine synthetase B [Magnetospirillum sp.]
MSAIAGLLCLDRQSIDADPAERMAAALGWRGGAEDGCYRSPEGRAVLAARPLAGTAQPLTNETHDVWLVLDGEIHNHRELRHTLTLLGHRFRSGSDVEVALHAYEQWDLDFPTHLHGAFALALWDDRRDRLVLARDRLGRKPLFVARHRGRLGFASGIGALMDELDLPRRLDPVALSHYLTVGTVPAPATLVAGISLLGGGEMLVCERGQTPRRRRWRWLTPDGSRAAAMRPLPAERHAGNLRTLLECAVADRLGSDGRAGVYLAPSAASGAIAAIATRLTGTPPATVAVCDDPHGAAAAEVQRLAQAAGVQPDLIRVSAGDVAAALPALVGRMVAPVASPAAVPTWFAAARSAPTRPGALLADGGAEELLLTRPAYAPYRCGPWRRLWQTLLPARRRPLEQNLPPGLRLFRDDVAPLLEVAVPAAVPLGPPLPDWLAGDRLGAVGVYDLALRVADGAAPAWDAA